MKRTILLLLLAFPILSAAEVKKINVVPYPNQIEYRQGNFNHSNNQVVCASNLDKEILASVIDFASEIHAKFAARKRLPDHGYVFCADNSLDSESYVIDVTEKCVKVSAKDLRGFNYAITTILQMLPEIPCCRISDSPRFSYRGLHLDESRHFFGKKEVMKYLDIMAYHKLNTFHWHLTDDQGWRIEIKKYPKLIEVGTVRNGTCIKRNYKTNDGIPYGEGMYYTHEDIKEIVAYAASKGIDVIPEIDLPGHMLAALAAYPHLGCTGGPYQVWHRWGVSKDVLCVGNEEAYSFLEDVLAEVCELFPGKYIHIGGDECPKDSWKTCPKCQAKIKELGLKSDGEHDAEHYLQSYVMNRVEDFLKTKGRSVIGWDEILDGSPSKSATVMSWRGEKGGIKAAALGHDVIMTPNTYCYWDYYQATDVENEPFAIGGYVPVELVYSYEPYTKSMNEQARERILGVQANMWTEYISESDHLEYMLLPRLAALSEVQWCRPENKDWERFLESSDELCAEYRRKGYRYANHIFGVSGKVSSSADGESAAVELYTQGNAQIRYTLDGSIPTVESTLYTGPIKVNTTCVLKASAVRIDTVSTIAMAVITRPYVQKFDFHKAVGCPLTLVHPSEAEFSPSAGVTLLDGIRGPAIHRSKEWCAWQAKPLEAVIDMSGSSSYSTVEIGYFSNKPSQIFNPISLEVSVSEDGVNFVQVTSETFPAEGEFESDGLKSISVKFPAADARYVKVKAGCLERVPKWHHYDGRKAWIYIDEIIVE